MAILSLAALACLLWLIGAGAAELMGRLSGRRLGGIELALIAGPFGASLVCWLLYLMMELGLADFSPGLARLAVVLPAAGLGIFWLAGLRGCAPSPGLRRAWSELPWWARLMCTLLAAFLFGQLAHSISNPLADWDARMYHLPYSHVIFRTGALPGFASPSCNDCFAYPPASMMLYALGWAWLGDVNLLMPKMLNILFGLSSLGWVYLLVGRGLESSRGTALFAVILAAVYTPIRWSGEGTDWMLAFWSVAALHFALRSDGPSWMWAGICSGLAVLTKHHGLISLTCLAPAMLTLPGGPLRRAWRPAAASALALAIAAPWLVRNWMLWGNPIYPAAMPVLGGAFHDDWVQRNVWSFWQQPRIGYRMFYAVFCFIRVGLLLPLAGAPFAIAAMPRLRPRLWALWIYLGLGLALFVLLGVTPNGGGLRLFGTVWMAALCMLAVLVGLLDDAGRPRLMIWAMAAALLVTQAVLARDVFMALTDESQLHRLWDRVDGRTPGAPEIVTRFFWPAALLVLWAGRKRLSALGGKMSALAQPGTAMAVVLLAAGWWHLVAHPVHGLVRLARGEPLAVDWQRSEPWKPYGRWVGRNLPQDAVLLTFNSQRWVIPRTILSADSPLLERAYAPDAGDEEILELLAGLGVTHVIENDHFQSVHPLNGIGPLWRMVAERKWFGEVYRDESGERALRIYEILYPPEIERLRSDRRERPWLYGNATIGPLSQ